MEWKVVDEDYDYHQEIATSCYGDMLHDDERNKKFGAALKNAINKVHQRGKKAHVLDIGTGTGLLAMLAVRNGADTVVACEMFQPVADCAKKIIAKNGFADRIKVVSKHSTALVVGPEADLPHRANILVSEVFDTELIGEGALQTFNHAHRVLLEDNSIVIPSVGTIYGQIVESKSCLRWNNLEDWRIDEKRIVEVPSSVKACPGAPSLHDIQLSQLPCSQFKALSPPLPLFRFDFMRQKLLPNDETVKKHCLASASGTAHVFFMWWDLIMDDDGQIILSCAPAWHHPDAPKILPEGNPALNIPWRDHWMQAIYFFPKQVEVYGGQDLILRASHDEFSFWYDVGEGGEENAPICECGFHLYASRTRIGALNDPIRRSVYLSSLQEVAKHKTYFVVFGDFSFLPLLIAKMDATKVMVLTKSFSVLNEKAWKQFIATNSLENIVTFHNDLPSVVEALKEEIDSKSKTWKEVCVLGEPFFQTSLVAWNNVYFLTLLNEFFDLIKSIARPEDVGVFVKELKIRACCVQFDDLHKISRPINKCMGLDMSHFDKMISKAKSIAQRTPEPQPLWEYPCRAESEAKTLIKFDFQRPLPTVLTAVSSSFNLGKVSRVDGIAVWAEWKLANGGIINTGATKPPRVAEYIQWDRFERQGIHLFEDPCVADDAKVLCSVTFDPKTADFDFSFSIETIKHP